MSGSMMSARARETRCSCPPESWPGRRLSMPGSRTSSIISLTRRRRVLPVHAAHAQTEGDVVADGHVREEQWLLEDHGHVAPLSRDVHDRPAVEPHVAGGGLEQARQHLHRRRLAAAGRSEEGHQLALGDAHADAVDAGFGRALVDLLSCDQVDRDGHARPDAADRGLVAGEIARCQHHEQDGRRDEEEAQAPRRAMGPSGRRRTGASAASGCGRRR